MCTGKSPQLNFNSIILKNVRINVITATNVLDTNLALFLGRDVFENSSKTIYLLILNSCK